MIVCSNCGTSNRDDERFCGNCGAFLEWEGTPVERGGGADPAPAEPDRGATDGRGAGGAAGTSVGTSAGVGSGPAAGGGTPGGGTALTGAGTAVAGGTALAEGGGPGVATPSRGTTGTGGSGAGAGLADPDADSGGADSLAAGRSAPIGSPESELTDATAAGSGGSESTVAPLQPAARQPGQGGVRRPVRRLDEPTAQPTAGERPCPKCGSGNDSARRFCRACGSSLQIVVEEEKLPWWRRLLNRLTKRRQRRDRRSTGMARRLIKITAFLCVLAILAVVGPPLVSRAITAIRDRTQPSDPIIPIGVTASSSAGEETPPERIVDGATNRFWAPEGPAVDAWVEATFAQPTRLTDVLIHSGVSTNQERFLTAGRPNELTLIATSENGDTVEELLVLRDRPGEQKFAFRASGVIRVRLLIRSTYGPGLQPAAALAEVEFFGRT